MGQVKKRKVFLTGFTLIEVLLAAGILAFGICGVLVTYLTLFVFSDLNRNFTLAANSLQAKMEEMKRTNFATLPSLQGTTFNINGFSSSDAKGRIEVSDTDYSDLKRVRLIICLRSRGRVIGEDANLDGVLNSGEDSNGNGRLDSPLEVIGLVVR